MIGENSTKILSKSKEEKNKIKREIIRTEDEFGDTRDN